MPKSYDTPGPKREPESTSRPRKTVGVYGRPERTAPSRAIMIALAVIVVIAIVFLWYRVAPGAKHAEGNPSITATVTSAAPQPADRIRDR